MNGIPDVVYPPQWTLDLYNLHAGKVARQFVLHFNITDVVIDMEQPGFDETTSPPRPIRTGRMIGQPMAFRSYLYRLLRQMFNCQHLFTYSLAAGLIADEDIEQRQQRGQQNGGELQRDLGAPGWQLILETARAANLVPANAVADQNTFESLNPPTEALRLLTYLLRQSRTQVGVIIDYAEKLMPVGEADGHADESQLVAVEIAQRWAIDPFIRDTANIILLLTNNIGQLTSNIHVEGSGTRTVRVPLPDDYERTAFLSHLYGRRLAGADAGLAPLDPSDFHESINDQLSALSTMTQGMRLSDIDHLNRRLIMEARLANRQAIIRQADVQAEKEQVIQSQSEQLLEVLPRNRGFTEIGGLKKLKDYLKTRADLMLQHDRSPVVPMGLLLAGPPGTGKTIIAEALAKEGGFNLVKLRNIQDRWVGSSERNLDMVLNLLKDLSPVVVFVDEIDQAIGRRDTGQGGDSGVSARMFARILEELSNNANRGRILWIAASNRPDLLDDALLRRFDRVVPLLIPDLEETQKIFCTMPRAINKQTRTNLAYGGDLSQHPQDSGEPSERDLAAFKSFAERSVSMGLTGAGIEVVVRRAIEFAMEEKHKPYRDANQKIPRDLPIPPIEPRHLDKAIKDYKPNHDPDMYILQSLYAIAACNFQSVLPPLPSVPPFSDIIDPPPGGGSDGRGMFGQRRHNDDDDIQVVNQEHLAQQIQVLREQMQRRRVI